MTAVYPVLDRLLNRFVRFTRSLRRAYELFHHEGSHAEKPWNADIGALG